MKLYYYKDPIGNFGDDLNPLIWDALAGEIFDGDGSSILLGIGTLINSRVPEKPTKLVFGSGVGYLDLPKIDTRWKFYCVRGPLSAQRLNLDKSLAITDPAILLTQVVGANPIERTQRISFMPHHTSAQFADWRDICEKSGMNYIDPTANLNEVITQIRQSKLVIAEAMHGAIVADAFRVPWVPVACYDHILSFKWNDWCQSLNLEYRPLTIQSIWDIEKNLACGARVKSRLKHGLKSIGIWSDNWTPPVPRTNKGAVEEQVIASLRNIANGGHQFLSKDQDHQEAIARLLDKLAELKIDLLNKRLTTDS